MGGSTRERFVVTKTLEWLVAYYERCGGVAVSKAECAVVDGSPHGNGRVDGVVAVHRRDGSRITVALEAKSRRTARNVVPTSPATAGGGGFLGAVVQAITTVFSPAEAEEELAVVEQVRRYPGAERWIALARDQWQRMAPEHHDTLERACRVHGIGLVTVGRLGDVAHHRLAAERRGPGDFLDHYKIGAHVRRELEQKVATKLQTGGGTRTRSRTVR